jgi:hypothetical protein
MVDAVGPSSVMVLIPAKDVRGGGSGGRARAEGESPEAERRYGYTECTGKRDNSRAVIRVDPVIPRCEKCLLVIEAIGGDKGRVNHQSLS